ncbi:MAG: DUF2779 domain-containing protein [Fibrobacterales bacterium]
MALAEGGFQVGELAKLYYPGGHDIITLDYEESLEETNELLKQENVIIYEAAIKYKSLFIRADILVKTGNKIDLIEVKAKSFDPDNVNEFETKAGYISSTWKPYLYDIAFQKYVTENAFPSFRIRPFLMLVDKTSNCPTDGLNQKFMITKDYNGHSGVTVSDDVTKEELEERVLSSVNVENYCNSIYEGQDSKEGYELQGRCYTFAERIEYYANQYEQDIKISSPISSVCGTCEFDTTSDNADMLSGKRECFKEQLSWSDADFEEQTVFDIWNCRAKDKLIADGKIKMRLISEEDLKVKSGTGVGISPSERQWLQVEKAAKGDITPFIDVEGLKSEMSSWVYPLHFIDFETSMVAIPFNKGRRPYEGIAFQFSHHTVFEDGRVEHTGEFLHTERGVFPNYEFVRALKTELETDAGSIFKYSAHENTYLKMIKVQILKDNSEIPDRDDLIEFIDSITNDKKNSKITRQGSRDMIDLLDVVKKYYYDPAMGGSNSIKQVLPAMLNSSAFLKEKYSKPIYGAAGGMVSLNFNDWTWITYDEAGKVIDPYKRLPPMFDGVSDLDIELLSSDPSLADGGAAMTAYARMQFSEMSDAEREEVRKALLKYCELDTLAMVMIYEGWMEMIHLKEAPNFS